MWDNMGMLSDVIPILTVFPLQFPHTAVSVLCEGSCRAVEFIGKGLCHILDVAVGFLKLTELACGWISSAIQFVLTQLFRIHRYVPNPLVTLGNWTTNHRTSRMENVNAVHI